MKNKLMAVLGALSLVACGGSGKPWGGDDGDLLPPNAWNSSGGTGPIPVAGGAPVGGASVDTGGYEAGGSFAVGGSGIAEGGYEAGGSFAVGGSGIAEGGYEAGGEASGG